MCKRLSGVQLSSICPCGPQTPLQGSTTSSADVSPFDDYTSSTTSIVLQTLLHVLNINFKISRVYSLYLPTCSWSRGEFKSDCRAGIRRMKCRCEPLPLGSLCCAAHPQAIHAGPNSPLLWLISQWVKTKLACRWRR